MHNSLYEFCSQTDKMIKKFLPTHQTNTSRSFFNIHELFLLTTENEQLDIYHMSTPAWSVLSTSSLCTKSTTTFENLLFATLLDAAESVNAGEWP